MSGLKVRSGKPGPDGTVLEITPQSAGWTHVGFAVHRLETGNTFRGGGDDREHCLVILSGRADILAGEHRFVQVGERASVFDGPASSVFVPGGMAFTVCATEPLEIAVCSAPGGGELTPRLIPADSIEPEVRGHGTNQRIVYNILPDTQPAHSLLVVEVITPAGHWSSYPPHKHDRDALPVESSLEETYYHRISPPQGFALQRVYTDDRSIDETMAVEDGDCVMVPRGYHPVGAPHGYTLYYLNVMAGPQRNWTFANDPAHAWIMNSK